jgi:hypothetical protein
MAKYLRVGVHNPNMSGYTSKAWTIRRRKSVVVVRWGSVEVRGAAHGRPLFWAGRPREKLIRCGSERRAVVYLKNAMAKRVSHQYERLPGKVRIGRPRKRR